MATIVTGDRLNKELSGRVNGFMRKATDLTGSGTGAGTVEMAADYSSADGIYTYGPPTGEVWEVARTIFYISDNAGVMAPDEFGGGSSLTNGFSVNVVDSTGALVRELANGYVFQTNGDLARVMYDVSNLGAGAGGNDAYTGRWTFTRAGTSLRLIGDAGHKIEITISDDISNLVSMTWYVDAVKAV